jgi:hypothetical protein
MQLKMVNRSRSWELANLGAGRPKKWTQKHGQDRKPFPRRV